MEHNDCKNLKREKKKEKNLKREGHNFGIMMKMAKPETVVNAWNSKKGQSAYQFWRICTHHCYLYKNMLSDSFHFSVLLEVDFFFCTVKTIRSS